MSDHKETIEDRHVELTARQIIHHGLWIDLSVPTTGWTLNHPYDLGPGNSIRCIMCDFEHPRYVHEMEHERGEELKDLFGEHYPFQVGCVCAAHMEEDGAIDFAAILKRVKDREKPLRNAATRAKNAPAVAARKVLREELKAEKIRLKEQRQEQERIAAEQRWQESQRIREAERIAREEREAEQRQARLAQWREQLKEDRRSLYLSDEWGISERGNQVLDFDDTFVRAHIVIYASRSRWKWLVENTETHAVRHATVTYSTVEQAKSALFPMLAAKGIV